MNRKVVVFGSGGQLGAELCQEFLTRSWQVHGFERHQADVTEGMQVDAIIAKHAPAVVVNAAAFNQVDLAESQPALAFQINALAVFHLATACRQYGAQLVHFSTDYVFDGAKGQPYEEGDSTRPIGAYAVSKLAGEHYASAYLAGPLVIRTSGVFGPAGRYTPRGNFVELMLRLASEGKPIRVVSDFIASPTYVPPLAARTADLVEQGATGIFHIGGGEPSSWYDFAKLIFAVAGQPADLLPTNEREYRTAARRPKFSALANRRMDEAGLPRMPALADALGDYFTRRPATTSHRSA